MILPDIACQVSRSAPATRRAALLSFVSRHGILSAALLCAAVLSVLEATGVVSPLACLYHAPESPAELGAQVQEAAVEAKSPRKESLQETAEGVGQAVMLGRKAMLRRLTLPLRR